MVTIWMLAGGTFAAAAVLLAARLLRQRDSSTASVQPVSDEWLSQARAGQEPEW